MELSLYKKSVLSELTTMDVGAIADKVVVKFGSPTSVRNQSPHQRLQMAKYFRKWPSITFSDVFMGPNDFTHTDR